MRHKQDLMENVCFKYFMCNYGIYQMLLPHLSRCGVMQELRCSSPMLCVREPWLLCQATTNTTTTATGQCVARFIRITVLRLCTLTLWFCSVVGIAWRCVVWTVQPVSLLVLLCSQCWDSWLMTSAFQWRKSPLVVSSLTSARFILLLLHVISV